MSQWSHLYQNHSWRKRRLRQLAAEPMCRYCKQRGFVTQATVADHIKPHKGDPVLFAGPIQSLCGTCHNSVKAREEGERPIVGCDWGGWPV